MSKTSATNVETVYKVHNKVIICLLSFEIPENPPFCNYELQEIINKLGFKAKNAYNLITVIGKARYNPVDKYNEVLGKRIAESRAKIKMFRTLKKINSKLVDIVSRNLSLHMAQEYHCFNAEQREIDHLNQLLADPYKDLSDEELKEIFEDMQADE